MTIHIKKLWVKPIKEAMFTQLRGGGLQGRKKIHSNIINK